MRPTPAAVHHQEDHRNRSGHVYLGQYTLRACQALPELLGREYHDGLRPTASFTNTFRHQSTFLSMMIAVTGVSWAYNVLAISLVASVPA